MQRLYTRHILRAAILPAALTVAAIAALFFPSSAAYAATDKGAEVTYTTRSDARLERDYLDWYGVSTDSEEEIIDRVKGIFSDYMQTKLLPEFNDRETILSLEEQLSGHPLYEGNLDRYIQRALSVLDGTLMTDVVNRQFTTDPAARGNFHSAEGRHIRIRSGFALHVRTVQLYADGHLRQYWRTYNHIRRGRRGSAAAKGSFHPVPYDVSVLAGQQD